MKQVQAWLGDADPGFTLKTYIHLMDSGVGDAEFLDEVIFERGQPAPSFKDNHGVHPPALGR